MQYSKEEKAMWLEDWKQSGKKARTYAKESGLIPQTFVSWTKPKKTILSLVEIPTGMFSPARPVQEILIEKGEVKIHIHYKKVS